MMLRECPFCKQSGNSMTGIYAKDDGHGCWVECDECQSQGPWFPSGQTKWAIAHWNARSRRAYEKAMVEE